MDACKGGRAEVADRLIATLKERVDAPHDGPGISSEADTAEEAAAFTCGLVQSLPDLALRSLVVTATRGLELCGEARESKPSQLPPRRNWQSEFPSARGWRW